MKPLPCDWCNKSDPCRFTWLDASDMPQMFCSIRCMENYVGLASVKLVSRTIDDAEHTAALRTAFGQKQNKTE
jgi:hypothetical protein